MGPSLIVTVDIIAGVVNETLLKKDRHLPLLPVISTVRHFVSWGEGGRGGGGTLVILVTEHFECNGSPTCIARERPMERRKDRRTEYFKAKEEYRLHSDRRYIRSDKPDVQAILTSQE